MMEKPTEVVIVHLPDGSQRSLVAAVGTPSSLQMMIFERTLTDDELAALSAKYPDTNYFSPNVYCELTVTDTGRRDAHGRRIFT